MAMLLVWLKTIAEVSARAISIFLWVDRDCWIRLRLKLLPYLVSKRKTSMSSRLREANLR